MSLLGGDDSTTTAGTSKQKEVAKSGTETQGQVDTSQHLGETGTSNIDTSQNSVQNIDKTTTGASSLQTAQTGTQQSNQATQSVANTEIPEWLKQAGMNLVNMAELNASSPTPGYTGDMVADFTPDQLEFFNQLRQYVGGISPVDLNQVLGGAEHFAEAPAQHIETQRIVDEGGSLGLIKDYMNPYTQATLVPQLAELDRQRAEAQKRSNASATMSGAYGDARHGIRDAEVARLFAQAGIDTTGRAYKEAWDQGMAHRTGDLDRFRGVDTQNAAYNEAALGRELAGTGAMQERGAADQTQTLARLHELLNSGEVQQGQGQAEASSLYNEFLRKYGGDQEKLKTLSSVLSSVPHGLEQTQAGTTTGNVQTAQTGSQIGQTSEHEVGQQTGSVDTSQEGTTTGTRDLSGQTQTQQETEGKTVDKSKGKTSSVTTPPDSTGSDLMQLVGTIGGAALAPVTAGGSTAAGSLIGSIF